MLAPAPRALTRSRRKVVLLLALVVGLVEIAGLLGVVPRITIGRLWISPSLVPAAVLLGLLGRRSAGRARDIDAAAFYWLTALAGMLLATILLDREGHLTDAIAVLLAALDEEVVYRFAVPTIVAAILVTFHVPSRPARVTGLTVAAVWFVLLPGHRMQADGLVELLPFVAFAALSALVVFRSGSILATTATHAVMNMLTIISFGGSMSHPVRAILTAVLLLLLVGGYGITRPRPAEPGQAEADTVIDLRDGVIPSLSEHGGPPRPVLEPVREHQEERPVR
jgi:hypothetical protein